MKWIDDSPFRSWLYWLEISVLIVPVIWVAVTEL